MPLIYKEMATKRTAFDIKIMATVASEKEY